MLLSDKYPYITNYFTKSIENKRTEKGVPISHCLLLYGQDLNAQYVLAKEIARLLNCNGDLSDDCECLNCKWIREEKHPAVLTISRTDNKPSDDTSKTVISVKQAKMIKDMLMVSSEFKRVFILCDRDNDNNIQGLTPLNFQEETANSMLKIIEEPNNNVFFIFLTKNKEDVLSTIISRAQCFNIPTTEELIFNYNSVENIIKNYWEFKRETCFDVSQQLITLSKEITPIKVLTQIQNYMLTVLKTNTNNQRFIKDIEAVEHAKKQFECSMQAQTVYDDLCLKLIK